MSSHLYYLLMRARLAELRRRATVSGFGRARSRTAR